MLENFSIREVKEVIEEETKKPQICIYLEEINTVPWGYDASQFESKGFFRSKKIQDFPLRGKSVFLIIRRRRWRHKERKNEIISNDYSFIAEGSKMTKELSDFLKGTGRYPGRKHQ